MPISKALLLMFTHGLPILFFTYIATDVFVRNKRKIEHLLLSLLAICYLLLFVEEYIRNQVDISYSPMLSSLWFSNVGICITGICFHFFSKMTKLNKLLPKYVYPYMFYLPVLFVIVNLATGSKLISAQQFHQVGIWIMPQYNIGYYAAMSVSILLDLIFIIIVWYAKKKTIVPEEVNIYNMLIWGLLAAIAWHLIFGYIDFQGVLPPYPYLYSGIIWCYLLKRTMRRYDFLNLYDKRFEKLFQLNPNPIILSRRDGSIKLMNEGARQLLKQLNVDYQDLFHKLDQNTNKALSQYNVLRQHEVELTLHHDQLYFQLSSDVVRDDHEPHILLVLRDITEQKKTEESIKALAFFDPLTGLPNRRRFLDNIERTIAEASKHNEGVALIIVDLDKLKVINDHYGHAAGDELIIITARLLREAVGSPDFVARISGDEFVLYIKHSPSKQDVARFITSIKQKFHSETQKYSKHNVNLSLGASFYPQDGLNTQILLNAADEAMYQMKRRYRQQTEQR